MSGAERDDALRELAERMGPDSLAFLRNRGAKVKQSGDSSSGGRAQARVLRARLFIAVIQ